MGDPAGGAVKSVQGVRRTRNSKGRVRGVGGRRAPYRATGRDRSVATGRALRRHERTGEPGSRGPAGPRPRARRLPAPKAPGVDPGPAKSLLLIRPPQVRRSIRRGVSRDLTLIWCTGGESAAPMRTRPPGDFGGRRMGALTGSPELINYRRASRWPVPAPRSDGVPVFGRRPEREGWYGTCRMAVIRTGVRYPLATLSPGGGSRASGPPHPAAPFVPLPHGRAATAAPVAPPRSRPRPGHPPATLLLNGTQGTTVTSP